MSNTVALGVVKLLDYTIAAGDHSGRKFYFSASSPDKSVRTYYFATESEMDRKRWGNVDKDNNNYLSPPPFPPIFYTLRDFKGAGIWSYSYIDYSGRKKWAFQQKHFFACEMGVLYIG